MLDLSAYSAIQSNLFVRINIPGYADLTFSDYHKELTINGVNYTGLGQLIGVGPSMSNLRTTAEEVAIVITGIPENSITNLLANRIKGSQVQIFRGYFNPETGSLLPISGNPVGKFQGIVSNYSVTDSLAMGDDTGSLTITFSAVSTIEQLTRKISGRRTNPADQNKFYPGDKSMDRVSTVANSNYNFGAM